MTSRIISVSTAPYDGYEVPAVFDSLAACGVKHVEPAFIAGYTEPFDESAFREDVARQYSTWLQESGLTCFAFSSHIDLGASRAGRVFAQRMDFAAALGAKVINTNAALRVHEDAFFRHMEVLVAHAERTDMIIALENPGNGEDNLFNVADDGLALVERIGSPRVRLNYDAGNTVSHRPGEIVPSRDAILAMPACAHAHVKDVRGDATGYHFVPLGEGEAGCAAILKEACNHPDLNVSIELPLRLHRGLDAQPIRRASPVDLATIEAAVRQAVGFVNQYLDEKEGFPA